MAFFFDSLPQLASQGALNYLTASINDSFREKALQQSTQSSKDLMNYQAQLQDKYQRKQNLEASSIMRRSKEAAGYNVNSEAGGFSPALGVSPSSSQSSTPSQMSPIDVASFLSLKSQVKVNEAQAKANEASARELNASAEGKEIENTRQTTFDEVLNENRNYVGKDGKIVIVPRFKNKGEYDARNTYRDYEVLNEKRYSDISMYKALKAKSELEEEVSKGAFKDNGVVNALVKMPEKQYLNLIQQTSELASRENLNTKNAEFIALKKKIAEDSSFSGLIDQLHDPNLSRMDKAEKILIFLVSLAASKI